MRRKWTEDEIFYLKGNYGKLPTLTMAKKLNRSKSSVENEIHKLQLSTKKTTSTPWTKKDEEFLRRNYENFTAYDIAKILRKSEASVKKKASQMNINSIGDEFLSVGLIAKSFQSDRCVVINWIHKGLPCKKIKRGKGIRYKILADDFWQWAEQNKKIIPWRKYEKYSILPEPPWLSETIECYKKPRRHRFPVSKSEIAYIQQQKALGRSDVEIAISMERTKTAINHYTNPLKKDMNKKGNTK